MNNKQVYKEFCEKERDLPLFLSYKWLEAVAPGRWDVAIEKKDDKIIGVYPYVFFNKYGFKKIDLTSLSAYGGAYIIFPEDLAPSDEFSFEKNILSNLIEKLPQVDSFNQKIHPSIQNWLPFYWKGFKQTTRYTYAIEDITNKDRVYASFRDNIRKDIKKAQKNISVTVSDDIEILFALIKKSIDHKGTEVGVSDEEIRAVYKLIRETGCGELLLAKEGDIVHCACLFTWDNHTCYYSYGVADPEFKNSGAMSLTVWEALQKYSSKVRRFDFDGSMIEGVEKFFRGFGAKQTPCHHIYKTDSNLLELANKLKKII